MIVISEEFLKLTKRHIRILNTEDDDLIKENIEVAVNNIYSQFLYSKPPENTDEMNVNVKRAVRAYVAMLIENPDGVVGISSRIRVVDKGLIQKILGSELRYLPKAPKIEPIPPSGTENNA